MIDILQTATSPDSTINISSATIYAAIASLVGTIGGGAALIRHLYETRLDDRDKTIVDRDRMIEKLEAKIERYEQRDIEHAKVTEQALASMQLSVSFSEKQGQLIDNRLADLTKRLDDATNPQAATRRTTR